MDREALKLRAANRRNGLDAEKPSRPKWSCEYCGHGFAHEVTFMRHHCAERKRLDELRSPVGQSAYIFYSEWMKAKKRSVPPIETFATSRLYTTFVKFADYATRTNMPNTSMFVRLMVEHDVNPTLWARDQTYALYIQWVDEATPPLLQAADSLEFLYSLADKYECAPNKVWGELTISQLAQHIQRRKLSPWFVLASESFREYMYSLEPQQRRILLDAIREGPMIERIKQEKVIFGELNTLLKAEGL